MTVGKTVAAVAGANATVSVGTEVALPAVPFLEVPLWIMHINGIATVMTPQALIVVTTGVLSVIALITTIIMKVRS